MDNIIRMVAAMKTQDRLKKGYLKEADIHSILKKEGLSIGGT